MDSPSSSLPSVINTNAVTERRNMKAKVGLWIDHREAIIVVLTEKGEEAKRIESTVKSSFAVLVVRLPMSHLSHNWFLQMIRGKEIIWGISRITTMR